MKRRRRYQLGTITSGANFALWLKGARNALRYFDSDEELALPGDLSGAGDRQRFVAGLGSMLKISLEADFSLSDGGEDLSIDATMLGIEFLPRLSGWIGLAGCL
ncbi:hypothetical protein HGRIS_001478 [Hohenbuehelia grisea]|uniref:Uncharacterized protein n=1 Tax=Hohenbuehelia grisea TaxID=104357 RepID=A0ABR3JQZ0_9AGAR